MFEVYCIAVRSKTTSAYATNFVELSISCLTPSVVSGSMCSAYHIITTSQTVLGIIYSTEFQHKLLNCPVHQVKKKGEKFNTKCNFKRVEIDSDYVTELNIWLIKNKTNYFHLKIYTITFQYE